MIQRDPIAMQEDLSGDIEDMRTIVANAISWLNPNDRDVDCVEGRFGHGYLRVKCS